MQHLHLAGKDYFLDDAGRVMLAMPHRKASRIDPQLTLQWTRLVFDRTLADPKSGGREMARFIAEGHIQNHYGPGKHYRMSRPSLNRLRAALASW